MCIICQLLGKRKQKTHMFTHVSVIMYAHLSL